MIGIFAAIASVAVAPPPAPPADPLRCAFQTAEKLALASEDAPASVADRVVALCAAELRDTAPAISDDTRNYMRAAALAMVERRRGLDGEPEDAPLRIAVPQKSLDIPDQIAPAVIPYFRCLLASAGQTEKSDGRVVPPPPGITKGSNCTAFREKAARDAERMLRAQGGLSKAARAAFVEKALQDMDDLGIGAPPPTEEEAAAVKGASE